MPYWEHFHYRSNIGVRGHGHTLASAFEQTALALTALTTDPAGLVKQAQVNITCEAADWELLLTDWLNSVVHQMTLRHMLFGRFRVQIEGNTLRASLWCQGVGESQTSLGLIVKGANETALKVFQHPNGDWTVECVLDI
jgi:SHS2 domain-containing protein